MKKPTALFLTTIILAALLSGCAAQQVRPVVDMKNRSQAEYEANVKECNEYADQSTTVGQGAAGGAGLGAALGAGLGAVVGAVTGLDMGETAATGAAVGGYQGAVAGGADAHLTKKQIVSRCMQGRGFNVLNP